MCVFAQCSVWLTHGLFLSFSWMLPWSPVSYSVLILHLLFVSACFLIQCRNNGSIFWLCPDGVISIVPSDVSGRVLIVLSNQTQKAPLGSLCTCLNRDWSLSDWTTVCSCSRYSGMDRSACERCFFCTLGPPIQYRLALPARPSVGPLLSLTPADCVCSAPGWTSSIWQTLAQEKVYVSFVHDTLYY